MFYTFVVENRKEINWTISVSGASTVVVPRNVKRHVFPAVQIISGVSVRWPPFLPPIAHALVVTRTGRVSYRRCDSPPFSQVFSAPSVKTNPFQLWTRPIVSYGFPYRIPRQRVFGPLVVEPASGSEHVAPDVKFSQANCFYVMFWTALRVGRTRDIDDSSFRREKPLLRSSFSIFPSLCSFSADFQK